jgi:uncharacterized membrane protein YfcA
LNWITNSVINTYHWAKQDYQEWPIRFILEITAWFMSIVCAVWMGLTLPNPPFLILYPLFIFQCAIFAWAAWTRKSTGMVANYLLLVTIDVIALIRLINI